MSMLLFMPWCPIDRRYSVGALELIPFDRNKPNLSLNATQLEQIQTILGCYVDLHGQPIQKLTVLRHHQHDLLENLSDANLADAQECVELACFSGLANRQYFSPMGPYCNTTHFELYGQRFNTLDSVCLVSRRREGTSWDAWSVDKIRTSIPVHAHSVREVKLDEGLLNSLSVCRSATGDKDWVEWQNAIACFNRANSDAYPFPYQVEWHLLASAFERILGAKPKAKDVADKFVNVVCPQSSLAVDQATRWLSRWTDDNNPLRYEWMEEFYRIRGDFAHGRLSTRQPCAWNAQEHLVLATIAFPLIVRTRLATRNDYKITPDDRSILECFERLAATPDFLLAPPDQQSSADTHWMRIWCDRHNDLVSEEIWREAGGDKWG